MKEGESSSLDGKSTGLLNGLGELLREPLLSLVRRQVDAVETGVCLRQVICVGVNKVNGEQPWAGCSC